MDNRELTLGGWVNEEDSANAFDTIIKWSQLWDMHTEVPGSLIQPRPGQSRTGVRIDRVLVPAARLVDLGWTHGIIGVEIKRSGDKIGRPIAQAIDYGRSIWALPPTYSMIWLDWVFIWPMAPQNDTVSSICAQNRIGSAYTDRWRALALKSGPQVILTIDWSGVVTVGTANCGRQVGSR